MNAILLVGIIIGVTNVAYGLDGDTFTVNCHSLTIQRSDPIVYPGVAGAHVHSIIGGNAFRRSMTGTDATKATQTSCDKFIDRSNYWVPQMYHQRSDNKWEMVPWTHSAVYYQKRACNYAAGLRVCDKSIVPMAFPDGFRMTAGDPLRRTQNNTDPAQRAIDISCLDGSSGEKPGFPTTRCSTLRSQVYFPSCWDGKNLDSPNHQSHMAYPAIGDFNGGVCPQSHPVALLSIFYEFFFDTSTFTDINRFAFANGDPTGFGYHGDFIMGWTNRTLLQTAHRDCISAADCPTLGNQPGQAQTLIYPAVYEEEVGLNGPIAKLPGNNPVNFPQSAVHIQ